MAQMPRSVGIPPLSDSAFEQVLAVGASNNSLIAAGGSDDTDGRINPLTGMGLMDEQYTMILQNLVNRDTFQVSSYLQTMLMLQAREADQSGVSRMMRTGGTEKGGDLKV